MENRKEVFKIITNVIIVIVFFLIMLNFLNIRGQGLIFKFFQNFFLSQKLNALPREKGGVKFTEQLSGTTCFLVKALDLSWQSLLLSAFKSNQPTIFKQFSIQLSLLIFCESPSNSEESFGWRTCCHEKNLLSIWDGNLLCIIVIEGLMLSILLKCCKN